MNLYSVNTGYFKLDGGAMFGVVPKVIWDKLNPADENNLCNWAMRSLLIEDGNKLILIDNGLGDKQDEKFFSHYYLNGEDSLEKSLAQYGFNSNDITDVILTHLHFDHCGGSIKREGGQLVPAFKNARFWSNALHWQTATQPNAREKASFLKENILPIEASGQLHFVPMPENNITGGLPLQPMEDLPLNIRFVSGHTEGMMLPQLTYKDSTIVFAADLIPSVWHIPMPYVMAYDMFPLTTLNEKYSFLNEAADGDYILFYQHDPVTECSTLVRTEKGIRVGEKFKLREL